VNFLVNRSRFEGGKYAVYLLYLTNDFAAWVALEDHTLHVLFSCSSWCL